MNSELPDLIVFSHLRWNFVFQRPQHLLTRQAEHRKVIFFEEPVATESHATRIDIIKDPSEVIVVTPYIPTGLLKQKSIVARLMRGIVDEVMESQNCEHYSLWYYTPMAIAYTGHLRPLATIYDCMDELSNFRFAPPDILEHERKLFSKADLVFTGGQSLFEAKRDLHRNVFLFPSAIDLKHFRQGRDSQPDPEDQKEIGGPRVGFFGVIDERLDLSLIDQIAHLNPKVQFVMVGPVVKINDQDLPRRSNIHYLGQKAYRELPAYLANWDVAIMPFALNESTRFISPTKTPEYLAAGRPVVSTAIRDVVVPYGKERLVEIARSPKEFSTKIRQALSTRDPEWLVRVDEFLANISWDRTFQQMFGLERRLYRVRDLVMTPRLRAEMQTRM